MLLKRILDVIPSDMPRMEYATRNRVHGCEVRTPTMTPVFLLMQITVQDTLLYSGHKWFDYQNKRRKWRDL